MSIISSFHLLDDLITVCARRRGHVYDNPMESASYKGNYEEEKTRRRGEKKGPARDSNLVSEISGRVEMFSMLISAWMNMQKVLKFLHLQVTSMTLCFEKKYVLLSGAQHWRVLFMYWKVSEVRGHCRSHNAVRRVNKWCLHCLSQLTKTTTAFLVGAEIHPAALNPANQSNQSCLQGFKLWLVASFVV